MTIIVQKFGGTSVATPERIRHVAEHALITQAKGHQVVIVTSAMSGETDRLLGLAHAVAKDPTTRETDVVVSTGEQVSVGLIAAAIHDMGGKAISLLGFQIPILTDGVFMKSRMTAVSTDAITAALNKGNIVVLPGFQGITPQGEITTLGRGGSDTSAVAIAAALKADCEIYTDVDGVYSADPRMVPNAQKIHRISYEELMEMASAGAKVMQMRSVELAAKYNVPLHIRSSFHNVEGTWVTDETPEMESVMVSSITSTMHESRIAVRDIPDRCGLVAQLFEPMANSNINVDMIVQTVNTEGLSSVAFTVGKEDLKKAMQLTENGAKEIGAGRVEVAGDVSKVSAVGLGMRSHAGVAVRMFKTLAALNINIQSITTSEIKISVIIEMARAAEAVKALHTAFGLDKPQT
ncbi:MAG: aspartate kinase [Deltaproteobacteria bacterium CG11_big_fil_rev_8_21_14_0_20_47_16]|nr:MAG: aspartate kinase [Deltaproteobacteria bacterium CG11_big_fil_rev_8_21_14_0_20_47_16]